MDALGLCGRAFGAFSEADAAPLPPYSGVERDATYQIVKLFIPDD